MNILKKIRLRRTPVATSIAVIGGGSWATALVKLLSENAVQVRWWLRDRESIQHIKRYHKNPRYLSQVRINRRKVRLFYQVTKAIRKAQFVIIAVPAAYAESVLETIPKTIWQDKIIISAVKGIIPAKNLLISDYFIQHLGLAAENCCAIAGPCHAEEVALEKKSYLTIAGVSEQNTENFASHLRSRYLAAHTNPDLEGIEYCAVIKNIIALACGIAHGLGYGDNFQAVLVANAMEEIERFLTQKCPNNSPRLLMGSAYLGDLLVTAYSQFSRNRTFGNMLGRGYTVQSAQMEMNMVAEGYFASKCIYEIAEGFAFEQLPIIHSVYHILYEQMPPSEAFRRLAAQLK